MSHRKQNVILTDSLYYGMYSLWFSDVRLSNITVCHHNTPATLNLDFRTQLTKKTFRVVASGTICQPSQNSVTVPSPQLIAYLCSYSRVYSFLQDIFLNSVSHHAHSSDIFLPPTLSHMPLLFLSGYRRKTEFRTVFCMS